MLPFLIIGLLAIGLTYVAIYSAVFPNDITQKTAERIPKYADRISWDIRNDKKPCLLNIADCQSPPSKILLKTETDWPTIFNAYRKNLGDYGWSTNARIVTSIPTSIVFTNEQGCTVELSEDKSTFTKVQDRYSRFYIFTIICKK